MQGITRIIDLFDPRHPFILENGEKLNSLPVAYETHGQLNSDGTNAVLICHALTGDAHVAGDGVYTPEILAQAPLLKAMKAGQKGWWDGMIGPGRVLDTDRYYVICSNILGSCYGTAGPSSINPDTGHPYRLEFPRITVRDMVHLQHYLLKHLGVNQLALVTGGSLGGMQTLEWALLYPEFVKAIAPIATAARHSDWCIGINHLERDAIMNDPDWAGGNYEHQPADGLGLARKIGMISYRTDRIYNKRFAREQTGNKKPDIDPENRYQVESYLAHQGEKLVKRFDANCYIYLTWAMDQHDVSRGRGTPADVLASIIAKTTCVGINSDILYPAHEQKDIARAIPGAGYAEISSDLGHDAFLVEFGQLDPILRSLLDQDRPTFFTVNEYPKTGSDI